MVRCAFEDNKRHHADILTNSRVVKRLVTRSEAPSPRAEGSGGGSVVEDSGLEGQTPFLHVFWRDIAVGDLLYVECNQEVAADMVLLAASEPTGIAYVSA